MWMKGKTSHLVCDCVIVVGLVILHRDVEFVWASASVLQLPLEKRLMQSERNKQLISPTSNDRLWLFYGLKCTFIQKKIWMFLEFCDSIILTNTISQMDISLQAAGKQLRYSIVFSALANHIYMKNCNSLCTLFHISVANCKWGSVCNVESRTLLVGVCKLRTGESLMYLRHNHLCN